MTAEEILEGNKLIAEFIGYEFINDAPVEYPNGYMYKAEDDEGFGNHTTIEELEYHSSWDWLIPVVENIEECGCIVEIWLCLGKGCRITKGSFKSPILTIANIETNSTIEAVYLAVLDFIKWYNTPNSNYNPR